MLMVGVHIVCYFVLTNLLSGQHDAVLRVHRCALAIDRSQVSDAGAAADAAAAILYARPFPAAACQRAVCALL